MSGSYQLQEEDINVVTFKKKLCHLKDSTFLQRRFEAEYLRTLRLKLPLLVLFMKIS